MVITFLLSLTVHAAATTGPRPKFHHRDCQACLLDHRATLRGFITPRFRGAERFWFSVERATVATEPPEDFAVADPQFIRFSTRDGVPAIKPGRATLPPRAPVALDPDAPLGEIELRALGLDRDVIARPGDLVGWVGIDPRGWRLRLASRQGRSSTIDLPVDQLELGFTNKVYEWQWAQIAGRRWGPRATRDLRPLDFLTDYAHTALTRVDEARRYGYFIRTYPGPAGNVTTRLEITRLRPSPRRAVDAGDVIFPRASDETEPFEAPPIHWGVSDLGLRLVLAPIPTPE